jgi:hypothetical protein
MNDTARGTCRLQHHNNDRHITPPPAVNHSAGEQRALRREITKRWKSDNVIYMYEEAPAAGCLNSYAPANRGGERAGARFFAEAPPAVEAGQFSTFAFGPVTTTSR